MIGLDVGVREVTGNGVGIGVVDDTCTYHIHANFIFVYHIG
jgi:hypothetical protein